MRGRRHPPTLTDIACLAEKFVSFSLSLSPKPAYIKFPRRRSEFYDCSLPYSALPQVGLEGQFWFSKLAAEMDFERYTCPKFLPIRVNLSYLHFCGRLIPGLPTDVGCELFIRSFGSISEKTMVSEEEIGSVGERVMCLLCGL